MADMTWKQFKDVVDKVLQEKGISEDTEIWYIDIAFPKSKSLVVASPEMGLTIID